MPSYHPFFQLDPAAFVPFNDAQAYLSGSVLVGERDSLEIVATARNQLVGWHNIGGRTAVLRPHSFTFSVDAYPVEPRGMYSIGIIGRRRPSINVAHFICSSVSLYEYTPGMNYYSGWAYDDSRTDYRDKAGRVQRGLYAPYAPLGRHHTLTVGYDSEAHRLRCLANGLPLIETRAELQEFVLEIRLEAVGIDGELGVRFENLYYASDDTERPDNIAILRGWDPQYAPVFISYSHHDKERAEFLLNYLRSHFVRVSGDWDFKIGDSLIACISTSISTAGYLIVLLSAHSVESPWVMQELEIALSQQLAEKQISVLPVLIEDCTIPTFLRNRLYLDLREVSQGSLEKLLETIRSLGKWQ